MIDEANIESHAFHNVLCKDPRYAGAFFDRVKNMVLRDPKRDRRPVILCEYSHAMGNSNGGLAEYFDIFRNEAGSQGGFIWEWCDHALRRKTAYGRDFWAYGGDFGEQPNDANFVCDGIVGADRTPHPAAWEFQHLARPVSTAPIAASAPPVAGPTPSRATSSRKNPTASRSPDSSARAGAYPVPFDRGFSYWHGFCLSHYCQPGCPGMAKTKNKPTQENTMLKKHHKLSLFAVALAAAGWVAGMPVTRAQDSAPTETVTATVEQTTTTVVTETTTAAAPAEPSLEGRIADLEAYINNVDRPSGDASKVKVPGPGHNAWQMVSTALVLFMTLPGLALFYGGLVRSKNVLSILAMCLGIAGLVTILWWAVGYSLTFAGDNPFIGNLSNAMFAGMSPGGVGAGYYWISDYVWAMFQLTFAIITPALIFGATAERMKFSAVLIFTAVWMFVVYFPLAHMVWSVKGFMCGPLNPDAGIKAIDFAGGTVVHMSSGWSALILCIILGPRLGFGKEPMPPHSMVLCMIGTGMLFVGWFGFNAGSALGADAIAANAFTTTFLCAATAGFVWALAEWITRGKPSVLGFCSGIVAGLVVITPAAGFVTPTSAMIMAVFAGIVPFFAVVYMKKMLGYDDALDTFGVHAVGGTLGAILTGVFASAEANPVVEGLKDGLLMNQIKAAVLTIALSVVATTVIGLALKFTIGLRPSQDDESQGLDTTDHGEEGYLFEK